jgi:type III restriction enzyme
MDTLWVPGINGIGTFGSWAFGEFRQVFTIKDEFAALLDRLRPEMARQSAIHG